MIDHEALLRSAIELGRRGVDAGAGGPFGAVVAHRGEVAGEAHNEVLDSGDPTAHAEILAIRRAAAALGTPDLSGCVVYASCDPCPMCIGAYRWSRADALYVAATSEDAADIGFDDAAFHAAGDPPVVRLLRDEAAAMMQRWVERDLPAY